LPIVQSREGVLANDRPVLGRVNHYDSKSRRGTEVAAIFYSLIESAKLNGVEPKRYLKTALAAALNGKRIPLPHETT
jgi:transposase